MGNRNNNTTNSNDNNSNSNNYNYSYNKHNNEISHNTPYNTPPTNFDNKSSEYTSTSKGSSQYQTSGYEPSPKGYYETNRAPSPGNVNNCEKWNYEYSNSASNAPSTQGTDRYCSIPPPATNK